MEQIINGWEDCGNDYPMYYKKEGERVYSFVERVWLDITSEDIRNGVKEYAICSGTIDMNDYSEDDIREYLSTLVIGNGDPIKEYEKMHGLPIEYLEDWIAEEIFDQDCINDAYSWGGTYTEEEAEVAIEKYLKEN